ncbi:mannose-1-phosphate guanylyltransferase [Bacillus thuringiensis]|uniref:sugar phosphate nucleotidyltransferase n=1 Tax=Bacillus thuringiensis TaxID=1428 RepID=UPI0008FE917A|nr:sugar phosphate nucleotidyltransferase [Bacillus thuringiensis]OJE33651.1 mannose-1-phosphate guanylyltransferase [Bacillus thuringiensis]
MYLILLSGGSGQRLWPLSNISRSKQFLKVLTSKYEPEIRVSMIQHIWKQLCETGLSNCSVISTSKSQVDIVQKHLGFNAPLIIEPSRRDTYPAIMLSSLYLYSVKKISPDEVIVVIPVDLYVEEEFFEHIKSLEDILKSSKSDLVLVGINPIFPSQRYGYIVPDYSKVHNKYQTVNAFIEKPNEKLAKQLIKEGALWNAGLFTFKLGSILDHLQRQGHTIDYDEMVNSYSELPKTSFDYEFVEQSQNIIVVPYAGKWKDLGTWNSLTEELESSLIGKGNISSDCNNINIINELEIPVSVIGISNLIVAVSSDGILVADKNSSEQIKEMSNQFKQRPMYEERRWGWYRVLDYFQSKDGHEVLTKRIYIEAGENFSYQKHFHRHEVWTIVSGTGLVVTNKTIREIKAGDVVQIPKNTLHSVKAITNLEFIEVQTGTKLIEEDILRIFMSWNEIKGYCGK